MWGALENAVSFDPSARIGRDAAIETENLFTRVENAPIKGQRPTSFGQNTVWKPKQCVIISFPPSRDSTHSNRDQ